MLRTVYFYGDLGEKYGKSHRIDVKNVGEALRLMQSNYPGFRNEIKRDQHYLVVNGDKLCEEDAMNHETLFMNYKKGDFHIAPIIEGDKSTFGNIAVGVLGVALMVASYWVPPAGVFGYSLLTSAVVFNVGLALFATGVLGLLGPPPDSGSYGGREKPDERPSFLFDGPVNTVEQGGPVNLIYGRMIVGSTMVSTSLEVLDTNE